MLTYDIILCEYYASSFPKLGGDNLSKIKEENTMLAIKLSTCTWIKTLPSDWKKLRGTDSCEELSEKEYRESDFDNFVEILFREFAEKIKVRYCDVRDILYGHNIDFFEYKAKYFSEYDAMQSNEADFKTLTNLLLLPNVCELEKKSSVQAFLDSFNDLRLEDKVEILERLSNAKIEMGQSYYGLVTGVRNVIGSLTEQEKYKLVKSVFDSEVVINVELK